MTYSNRRNLTRVLATASVGFTLGAAAYMGWGAQNRPVANKTTLQNNNAKTKTDASNQHTHNVRLKNTKADNYYKNHKELPQPNIMHAVLPTTMDRRDLLQNDNNNATSASNKILVIGDVHGCFDEMLELHAKAVVENNHQEFEFVILVGDMSNKGPHSAKVLRWVRTHPTWFSVRGNHDDSALAAALGDKKRRKNKKYRWVVESELTRGEQQSDNGDEATLSDEDVAWLSELPYSITIPGSYLGDKKVNTIIVHGGLIPDQELKQQEITTMTTMREVLPVCTKDGQVSNLVYHERRKHNAAQLHDTIQCNIPLPWASVWKGPQKVIFGHDAKRGLQLYQPWAIGLDTGAVYGKAMTAVMLPEEKLVSIQTKEYEKPGK